MPKVFIQTNGQRLANDTLQVKKSSKCVLLYPQLSTVEPRGSTFADSELRGSKKYSKIKNIKKY